MVGFVLLYNMYTIRRTIYFKLYMLYMLLRMKKFYTIRIYMEISIRHEIQISLFRGCVSSGVSNAKAQRDLRKVPRVMKQVFPRADDCILVFQILPGTCFWNRHLFHFDSVLPYIRQRKALYSTPCVRATLQQPAHEAGGYLVRRSSPL